MKALSPLPPSHPPSRRSPLDGWRLLRSVTVRRRWLLLLALVLGWAGTVSLRWILPPRYRSTALLLAAHQSVPDAYVTPNVNFDPNALLESMADHVLSPARLQDIVSRFGLFSSTVHHQGMDAAVRKLRADISIQPTSLAGLPAPSSGQWSAVQITVQAVTPDLAQQIASSVTTDFIQQDLSATQEASNRTSAFLQQQLQQAQEAVTAAERQVQQYEDHHLGELPGQVQTNLAMSVNLQSALDTALQALARNQQEIAADRAGLSLAPSPEVQQLRAQLTTLQAHLRQLQAAGDTAQHPDVVATQAQIEAVQQQLQHAPAAAGASTGSGDISDNAVAMTSQLKAALAQTPQLQQQVAALRRQLATYQQRLRNAPLPATALAALENTYQQAQAAYQALLVKANASQMASALEQSQGGAQFELVNPPDLPRTPAWPNLTVLCWLGLAVGLGLGLGVSALAEIGRNRVSDAAELAPLGLGPVIVHIPPLYSPAQRRRLRIRHGLEWVAAGALLVLLAAGNAWLLSGR